MALTQAHVGPHYHKSRRAVHESVLQEEGRGALLADAMHGENVSVLGGHMVHLRLVAVLGD